MRQWLHTLWNSSRFAFGISRKQDELDEEVSFHIDELMEEGHSRDVTRKLVLREFGGVGKIKEECREAWGVLWLMGMEKEFRQGLRLLWKSKSFTAAVVLTLAICLAGNTVVFSILDKVLSPPAYPQPNRVVNLFNTYPGVNVPSNRLGGYNNVATYIDYSRNADSFESLALVWPRAQRFWHDVGVMPEWAECSIFQCFKIMHTSINIASLSTHNTHVTLQHRILYHSRILCSHQTVPHDSHHHH